MTGYFEELTAKLTGKPAQKFADQLAPTFAQAPHLPAGLVEFLASIAPWLVGLGGILGVFSGLGMVLNAVGLGSNWWMRLAGYSQLYFLAVGVLQLASAVILLMAFSPLKARKQAGWLLLGWNMVVNIAQTVVGVAFSMGMMGAGSLIWSAVGMLIAAYVLFELRSQYKA